MTKTSERATATPGGDAREEASLWTVHCGDAREAGRFLGDVARRSGHGDKPFITTTITSPPYSNLVDYGSDHQIGFGQTTDVYLAECEAVFADVFRWTKSDGSLWIIADTLLEDVPGGPSRLMPLPFMLAEAAARAGWVLRDVIVWRKDRTRPWSSRGRLRNGFEYVLYLVKSNDYKYYVDRLRDLRGMKGWWIKYPERHNPWGMAPDNVWDIPIPVQGSWASSQLRHACPFPPELVQRIIRLSTDEGDVVFDPFSGSGTVAATSEVERRRPLGTELNSSFVEAYRTHTRHEVMAALAPDFDVDLGDLTGTMLTLRALKYPKELLRQALRSGVPRDSILGVIVSAEPFDLEPRRTAYAKVQCSVIVPNDKSEADRASLNELLGRIGAKAPLSKYGLDVTTSVVDVNELPKSDSAYATYVHARTWRTAGSVETGSVVDYLENALTSNFPPILSPMRVDLVTEEP